VCDDHVWRCGDDDPRKYGNAEKKSFLHGPNDTKSEMVLDEKVEIEKIADRRGRSKSFDDFDTNGFVLVNKRNTTTQDVRSRTSVRFSSFISPY